MSRGTSPRHSLRGDAGQRDDVRAAGDRLGHDLCPQAEDLGQEVRGHGRACLWPACCPVPLGGTTALCPAPYDEAVAFLRSHDEASIPCQ